MCLLFKQTANNPSIPDIWLKNFYSKNPDGVGIMYFDDTGKIIVHKSLPKDENEFVEFYREHAEGKECLVHLRMKTHGDIDFENCHPYELFTDSEGNKSYLMHNGVLFNGNASDPSKSDTWHFIREYLRPLMDIDPALLHHEVIQSLLEEAIGSNRFGIIDEATQSMSIVNEQQGVYWGGRWYSNTYAWSAPHTQTNKTLPEEYTYEDAVKEMEVKPYVHTPPYYGGYGEGYTPYTHRTGKSIRANSGITKTATAKAKAKVKVIHNTSLTRVESSIKSYGLQDFIKEVGEPILQKCINIAGEDTVRYLLYDVYTSQITQDEAIALLKTPEELEEHIFGYTI